MALTAAPTVGLTAASDTGIRGDGVTNLARPAFTGAAPARSTVFVAADGNLLGVTTATAGGRWTFTTPAVRPLAFGDHLITAYALKPGQPLSAPSTIWLSRDATPPTVSLAYDAVNGRATLTFSERVIGVRQSNLYLSGQTQAGTAISATPVDSAQLRPIVGRITMSQSPDGKTFTFQEQLTLAEPGIYTLTLVKAGIMDLAGNPLAAGVATSFRVI